VAVDHNDTHDFRGSLSLSLFLFFLSILMRSRARGPASSLATSGRGPTMRLVDAAGPTMAESHFRRGQWRVGK